MIGFKKILKVNLQQESGVTVGIISLPSSKAVLFLCTIMFVFNTHSQDVVVSAYEYAKNVVILFQTYK